MNLESLALWLGQGFLHDQMVDKFWMFPMMETFHFIGLSFMFGALLVIDGRVLGIGKFISMKEAMKFIPVAIVAFASSKPSTPPSLPPSQGITLLRLIQT
jgi:hypothetical protein